VRCGGRRWICWRAEALCASEEPLLTERTGSAPQHRCACHFPGPDGTSAHETAEA
jgi:hypothetical protein